MKLSYLSIKHPLGHSLLTAALALAPLAAAQAYVGPGAGLSLLGALWGVVAAVGAALLFVLTWPLRRMRRRKREEAKAAEAERAQRTTGEPGQDQIHGPTPPR
ncbi:hypothetical protein [Salinisphaera sp. T31B1]|uniref:hypothetical protein n=1 Tax=Salinisphaera sp. T31B1 TaxID=727963 RepID=UPI003341ED3D